MIDFIIGGGGGGCCNCDIYGSEHVIMTERLVPEGRSLNQSSYHLSVESYHNFSVATKSIHI